MGPTNVIYTMDSDDMHSFYWGPPPCGERNGVVRSYNYRLLGPRGTTNILSDGSTDATSVTFSNAIGSLGGELMFQVAAVTVGEGPFGAVAFTIGKVIWSFFKTTVNDNTST